MRKIRYKLSPFNIISTLFAIWLISRLFSEYNSNGWYQFATIIFFVSIVVVIIIDMIIQALSNFKTAKIWSLEFLIISVLTIIYLFNQRTQNLTIQNLDNNVISIVYGFENSKALEFKKYSLKGEVKIPEDGILLTSSHISNQLPKTKIDLIEQVKSKFPKFGFTEAWNDTIQINNNYFEFSNWIVQKENCCIYSSEDIMRQKEKIKYKLKSSR